MRADQDVRSVGIATGDSLPPAPIYPFARFTVPSRTAPRSLSNSRLVAARPSQDGHGRGGTIATNGGMGKDRLIWHARARTFQEV
jgi:hypothetical protein